LSVFFAFHNCVFLYRPMPCTPAGDIVADDLNDEVATKVASALDTLYFLGYFNKYDVLTEAKRIAEQCGQVRWLREMAASELLGWPKPRG